MTVPSKDVVATVQVSGDRVSSVSHEGRYLKRSVEEENSVKPVSLGDEVTPAKNWNLLVVTG